MSAPFIIPFDNNPASTSIKTTSYTIPAGKYARVSPYFNGGPRVSGSNNTVTFPTSYNATLDGISFATSGATCTNIAYSLSTNASCAINSMPSNKNGSISFNAVNMPSSSSTIFLSYGSSIINWTGSINFIPPFSNNMPYFFNGGNLTASVGSAGGAIFITVTLNDFNTNKEIWVPSGTVLSGTASQFNWVVTEYNVIS